MEYNLAPLPLEGRGWGRGAVGDTLHHPLLRSLP